MQEISREDQSGHGLEAPKLGGAEKSVFGHASECALAKPGDAKSCQMCIKSDPKAVSLIRGYVKQHISTKLDSDLKNLETLKTLLGVKQESEIWQHPDFVDFVGKKQADYYLNNFYNPTGPRDNTNLISSININALMNLWNRVCEKKFGRKFYGLPYQMSDFADRGTQLARIDIPDLIKKGYDSFGVVMNTDTSDGDGEHWYCLYGDLKHKGTAADPLVIEYFNSSGNRLSGGKSGKYEKMGIWLEDLKHRLLRDHDLHLKIHTSASRQLQYSDTECGVWSLCYIHARLSGHPTDYFDRKGVTDNDMYEYRKHLFRA